MRNATVPGTQRTGQAARGASRGRRPRTLARADWSPARVPGRKDTSAADYSFRAPSAGERAGPKTEMHANTQQPTAITVELGL